MAKIKTDSLCIRFLPGHCVHVEVLLPNKSPTLYIKTEKTGVKYDLVHLAVDSDLTKIFFYYVRFSKYFFENFQNIASLFF